MKNSKKTKVVVTDDESICKTPEERERLFRFFQLLYEIDRRINATGYWTKEAGGNKPIQDIKKQAITN